MYIIVLTTARGACQLHKSTFTECGDAFDAARELSRDFRSGTARVFVLGEKSAIAYFEKGVNIHA
jgi:hypothetical protein